jgi:hypothetical protein
MKYLNLSTRSRYKTKINPSKIKNINNTFNKLQNKILEHYPTNNQINNNVQIYNSKDNPKDNPKGNQIDVDYQNYSNKKIDYNASNIKSNTRTIALKIKKRKSYNTNINRENNRVNLHISSIPEYKRTTLL